MKRWILRVASWLLVASAVFGAVIWRTVYFPRRVLHPPLVLAQGMLAIQHARIYTSPTDQPIEDGTILVRDGRIADVGTGIDVPTGATMLPCNGCVVTAGFWNAHVHFTQPKWSGAEWKGAAELNAQLADMFLSRGFTTVIDLGSNPSDTLAIRRRIESSELAGPFVYTAGTALYPPHGIPYYLRETLPWWIRLLMPQPGTGQEARSVVRKNLDGGADLTKLFTGSWVQHGHVLPMPPEIAAAAAEETHQRGKVVFAHPSNLAGTQVAIDSGVDVLAHAADDTDGITRGLLQTAVDRHVAMTPTLKMFATTVTTNEHYLNPIYQEVRQFHELGGTLMFGTDVGYMTDYSTEGEFEGLAKCGLDARDVLAMLTTHPAERMRVLDQKGTITVGKLADLTILDADPAQSLSNFSRVRMTVRSGKVAYRRP